MTAPHFRSCAGSFSACGYRGPVADYMFDMFLRCSTPDRPVTHIIMSDDVFAMYSAALEAQLGLPLSLRRARGMGLPYYNATVTRDPDAQPGTMVFYSSPRATYESLVGEITGWTL